MMTELENVVRSQSKLGEGPLWSVEEQSLYWVDIHNCRVEWFTPASRDHRVFEFDTAITALGFRSRGGFVAATARGIGFMQLSSLTPDIAAHPEVDKLYNRFNDAAVDPQGRFWGGTMYEGPDTGKPTEGRLYLFDADVSRDSFWREDVPAEPLQDSQFCRVIRRPCVPEQHPAQPAIVSHQLISQSSPSPSSLRWRPYYGATTP